MISNDVQTWSNDFTYLTVHLASYPWKSQIAQQYSKHTAKVFYLVELSVIFDFHVFGYWL